MVQAEYKNVQDHALSDKAVRMMAVSSVSIAVQSNNQ